MPVLELRLLRAENNLCDLARILRVRRIICVRYTRTEMIAIYQ